MVVKLQLLSREQVSVVSTVLGKWLPLCCWSCWKSLDVKLLYIWSGGGPSTCYGLAESVLQTWGCAQPCMWL